MKTTATLILELLADGLGVDEPTLASRLVKQLRRAIRPDDGFEAALINLSDSGQIDRDAGYVKRKEYDFSEFSLEKPIEAYLQTNVAQEMLNLQPGTTCFQRTATGGAQSTGIWSRPDFVYATIHRFKYNPAKFLDVIAMELKNAAGTNVTALHEALAHTRFANYAYLICPRLVLRKHINYEIKHEAARLGVGLIQFDVSPDDTGQPKTDKFDLLIAPVRRAPDPKITDAFIDDRFNPDTKEALLKLGG